jgi:hypothetical protein
MSKANGFETGWLQLVFQNLATHASIVAIGDGLRAAVTPGSLYISLHTADPGEAGTQATSEADYTGYARVAVARSAVGWTVTDNTADNAAEIAFAACTGGSNSITYFGVGTTAGLVAGNLLYSGALTTPLAVSSGITPKFAIGDLDCTED